MKTSLKIWLPAMLPILFGCSADKDPQSKPNSAYQAETVDYEKRIKTAGGSIDDFTLSEVDKFVLSAKSNGSFEKLNEICLFAGSNLNASLVKLVAGNNSSTSLKNNNFVESDYAQSSGFGPSEEENRAKFLESDFIPSTAGIDYNYGSVGIFIVSGKAVPGDETGILGTDPEIIPAEEGYWHLGRYSIGSGNYQVELPKSGFRMLSLGLHSGEALYFVESIQHGYRPSMPVGPAFSSPFTFFRADRFKKTTYSKAKIGGYYVGKALTKEQQSELDLALIRFNKALGRYPEGEIDVWIGDSVTSGVGTGIDEHGSNSFPQIVSDEFGNVCVNAGTPSGQLCVNTVHPRSSQLAAFEKVNAVLKLNPERVFITIGINDCNMSDKTTNGDPARLALFKTTLKEMINDLKAGEVPEIFVNSLPFFGQASKTKRNAYINVQKEAALETGVQFIDIHSSTLNNADAFHLTGDGHELAADAIIEALN